MEEIKVPKTIYVTKFRTRDGKEFDYKEDAIHHEKLLNGDRKVCPDCNGKGRWKVGSIPHQSRNELTGGWDNWTEDKYKECETCHGKGYLEKVWR